jgi:hypothetical protein
MTRFNIAYRQTLLAGRLTLGLMTPLARANGAMADPARNFSSQSVPTRSALPRCGRATCR